MTKAELEKIVAGHGMKIDGGHTGAGKFRDLYIGTGQPYPALNKLADALRGAGLGGVKISHVTNPDHEDYRKPMVEVESFWCDD